MERLFVKKLCDQIISNYRTPKYKAEGSIDTVISPFMDGIINQFLYDNQISEKVVLVAKEFPLKKIENNQSKNMDFLYASERKLYFIELKTSSKSFDKEQLKEYIKVARRVELEGNARFLLQDYQLIMKESPQSEKYMWHYNNQVKPAMAQVNRLELIDEVKIIYILPSLMMEKVHNIEKKVICISFQDLAQLDISELVDANTAEMWDAIKKVFEDINKIDIAS